MQAHDLALALGESGATAIEYGLIAAIIGVGLIAALGAMKTDLNATFGKVSTELKKTQ